MDAFDLATLAITGLVIGGGVMLALRYADETWDGRRVWSALRSAGLCAASLSGTVFVAAAAVGVGDGGGW